jgi:hypothetical protein
MGLGVTMVEDWGSPAFRDRLVRWVESAVGTVESLEQGKLRPWAAVWQVRTADRMFYLKQNCPGQHFEAELMSVLARLAPSHVVPVEAVDLDDGLLLTADQGRVFGETVAGDDLDSWCRLVVHAMDLARLTSAHGAELLATGVTPARVPDEVSEVVAPWQEELGALGLPDALVHNDLHEHNAFDRPDGLLFFDFADAVWAHPLTTLLVPLGVLSGRLGEPSPDDPRLQRVADAALEVWSDLAPTRVLRAALPAALRLGRLGRAESWARIEPYLTSADQAEYGGATAAWLARLPDPVPVAFP